VSLPAAHIDPALNELIDDLNRIVRGRLGPRWTAKVLIEQTAEPRAAPSEDELLTAAQVAQLLAKGESTVRSYMQRGELPATKIGGKWYARRSAVLRLVPASHEK
jgi:excisionase family DNA binding protein